MSLVKIGFFSLKDHTGCSSFAIHAANYIAGGDNSVAVIEETVSLYMIQNTLEPIFRNLASRFVLMIFGIV